MARLLGPDMGSRASFLPNGAAAANRTATVYSNEAGTILANIAKFTGSFTVPGTLIAGAQVITDSNGLLPRFWFPDDLTDRLYVSVNGGTIVPIDADYNTRLDNTKQGYHVKDYYAVGDGITDDTIAIQAAITEAGINGGIVFIPPGTYKLIEKLTVPSNVIIQGSGMNITILKQSVINKDGLWSVDGRHIVIRDLKVEGTGSGTGIGINMTDSNVSAELIGMTNVYVKSFGGDGVFLADPIASVYENVRSESNGGHGFNVQIGTSLTFNSCYAAGNAQAGYNMKSVAYFTMNSCAADANGLAYLIDGCTNAVLSGCGYESPTIGTAPYNGHGFKISGGIGHTLINCYCNGNKGIGAWFTATSTRNVCIGFFETGPVGATAAIQVDAGSRCTVITHRVVTANSFATGTTNVFSDANDNVGIGNEAASGNAVEVRTGGSLNQFVARRENTTSGAAYVLNQAATATWSWNMTNDSTQDAHIRNVADGVEAILLEKRGTQANISLLSATKDYQSGVGVIYLANRTTVPTASAAAGALIYSETQMLSTRGHFRVAGAGSGLRVAEGSNAKQGTAVLVAGTVTVANTSVTSTSRIFLTSNTDGGTPGFLRVSTRSVGVSFTITSSNAADTSTVAYQIFEPA